MRCKNEMHIFSGGMYGGKNTLIVASVDRREACSHDVTLSKNSFFDSLRPADRHIRRPEHYELPLAAAADRLSFLL